MMIKYLNKALPALLILCALSCQEKLEQLPEITTDPQTVSGEGIVDDQITMDNEMVTIPFKISLNAPAEKAFQVEITLNDDTVKQLIADNTLSNTVLMPEGALIVPTAINVPYGSSEATGTAQVKLTALERNYGKNVAFAFKLGNAGKDNKINASKSNILVVINTLTAIPDPSKIHYISIARGGGTIDTIEYSAHNYTVTPGGAIINLGVALSGEPGKAFNVKVALNQDTIAELAANGTISDQTIVLPRNNYEIDTMVRVNSNAAFAPLRITIPWYVFDANIIAGKSFGFAISLQDANKHVLHPQNSKIILVVDPSVNLDNNSPITGNGTGLRAEYFSNNQQLDFDGRAADLVRVDGTIDFGGNWPQNGISGDNFSTRWKGEFLAPVRGEYTFYQTRWDDGSRLIVNGQTLIDDFTTEWDKPTRVGKIFLERGQRYTIEAHHRENVGGQQARLEYEVPDAGIVGKRIVPRSNLFPAPIN